MPAPETKNTVKASILVGFWLRGEHDYQFSKNRRTFAADARASLDAIMGTEIPNKWSRFQFFRRNYLENPDDRLYLQANQQLLKATAAARAAVVWNGVVIGTNFLRANRASFNVFSQQYMHGRAGDAEFPDPVLLDQPLNEAIAPASITPIEGQYQPLPVFKALAGLAITHLIEQQQQTGNMLLPRLGLPSGEVQPWSNR